MLQESERAVTMNDSEIRALYIHFRLSKLISPLIKAAIFKIEMIDIFITMNDKWVECAVL